MQRGPKNSSSRNANLTSQILRNAFILDRAPKFNQKADESKSQGKRRINTDFTSPIAGGNRPNLVTFFPTVHSLPNSRTKLFYRGALRTKNRRCVARKNNFPPARTPTAAPGDAPACAPGTPAILFSSYLMFGCTALQKRRNEQSTVTR